MVITALPRAWPLLNMAHAVRRVGKGVGATLSAADALQESMLAAGMHRKPTPNLIIASIAEAHDAVLVHHDRDFDDIATVARGLRTRWIVSAGPGARGRPPA